MTTQHTLISDSVLTALVDRGRTRATLPPPETCRARRLTAKISIAEIAAALEVSEAAVAAWLAGSRTPRGRNRENYARLMLALGAIAESAEPQPSPKTDEQSTTTEEKQNPGSGAVP